MLEILKFMADFFTYPTTWLMITGAAVIILFERIFPYNRNQNFFRKGWWNDFFWYNIFQTLIIGYIIFQIIHFLDNITGLSKAGIISSLPFWFQLLFFVITHDLYIYWFHRLMHKNMYLWRLHEAHHSVEEIDWIAGARSHSIEILINQTVEYLPIFLLGANPEIILWKNVINSYFGMFIHSNIYARTNFFIFKYIINGPQFHRWHHSADAKIGNNNYATKFVFWDWIFGTVYLPEHTKCEKYGIEELEFPENYISQHVFAFRKFES
jgi:sterol desaturase/sphingolipid hydroxylase (fatty acid hydroxylase superfamily)